MLLILTSMRLKHTIEILSIKPYAMMLVMLIS